MLLGVLLESGEVPDMWIGDKVVPGLHEWYQLHGLPGWYLPERLSMPGLQHCHRELCDLFVKLSVEVSNVLLVELHAEQPVHQLRLQLIWLPEVY